MVRLSGGNIRWVEFPTLRAGKGGDFYEVISAEEQRQLVGQTCQIWGRPLRFSMEDHYQVFKMECDRGGRLEFSEALKNYEISFNSRSTSYIFYALGSLFLAAIAFRLDFNDKRRELLQQRTASVSDASSKTRP